MLNPNDHASDFSLPNTDGDNISLQAILGEGHNVLLIFLRHLG